MIPVFECEDCGLSFRTLRPVPDCPRCGSMFVGLDVDVPLWDEAS